MKIKKMTATFGALEQAVLTPGEGLTVITAPNEAGKSTWAGFLKAMLYGIDTKERDRTNFLADKNRYQPWSGAPMAGELQVEWQGKDITIRRFPARSNPFGGFEAVYTATGDPVPGLTAANVGEQLTGAGKEVYLRSAFVGQNGTAVGHSGELEARIAALATSGQEDVSYSAAERTLKNWRNRRRANRANGLIPDLEKELSAIDQSLRDTEQAHHRKAEAREQLDRLANEQAGLNADLETWDRIEKHDLNRRYGEALQEWQAAQASVPSPTPHPVFGTMTGEEAWEFAEKKQGERDAAEEENRRRQAERAKWEQRRAVGTWGLLLGGILAVCLLLAAVLRPLDQILTSVLCGAVIIILLYGLTRKYSAQAMLNKLTLVDVPSCGDLLSQAADYRETLAQAQQARAVADAAKRRVDDLAAQGGQLADTLELLAPPKQSKAAVAARLGAARQEQSRWQSELARAEGALAQMGDPDELEAHRNQLEEQLAERLGEYDALTAAMEVLSAANDALRERFSPALNREAGEIFSALTGGRWPKVSLARDFSAQATEEGGLLPRSSLALSAGTADQLYLAVRLAVCRLTLPGTPILLDDILTAFDDRRMALALDYLKKLGNERQILLFSCHSREGDWAKAHMVNQISL